MKIQFARMDRAAAGSPEPYTLHPITICKTDFAVSEGVSWFLWFVVLIYVVFGRVHVITLGVCSRLTLLASKREPCNFAENRKKYAYPKVSTDVKRWFSFRFRKT